MFGVTHGNRQEMTSGFENPSEWLVNAFAGGLASGVEPGAVPVGPANLLQLSPIWRALNGLCGDLATTPIQVHEVSYPDEKEVLLARPQNKVSRLLESPNPEMVGQTYHEFMWFQKILWGIGIAYIERDAARNPIALWPLNIARVFPVQDNSSPKLIPDIDLFYSTNNGEIIWLPREDTIRLPGLGDGIVGMALHAVQQEALSGSLSAQRFANNFYSNGTVVSGALSRRDDYKTKEAAERAIQMLKNEFRREYEGYRSAHRAAVLPEGWTWQAMGVDADKAQLIESRKYSAVQASQITGYPLYRIDPTQSATVRATVEEQAREYERYTLRRHRKQAEQEYTRQLLRPHSMQRGHLRIRYVMDELSTVPAADRMAIVQSGWRKIFTTNEGRALFGLAPDPEGDDLHKEAFAASPDQAGQEADQQGPKTEGAAPPPPQTNRFRTNGSAH